MRELRGELNIAFVDVTHDLAVVGELSAAGRWFMKQPGPGPDGAGGQLPMASTKDLR